MRVLFASSSAIALPCLESLAQRGQVAAVLTAPPAPAGRGRIPTPNPVDRRAQELGLPVLRPERLGSEARSQVEPLRCELLVSFAYGRIFGPKFLALFPLGGVNLHPSLLPRHRGPAPAPSAILAGDTVTGLTLQTLALEVDAGDILLQTTWPLGPTDTALSILERAAREAPSLLQDALDRWDQVWASRQPQDSTLATYSRLLQKEDGHLDWTHDATHIDRRVRACVPWPGAFTFATDRRLLVWEATPDPEAPVAGDPGQVLGLDKGSGIRVQTGRGHLLLRSLQWEGRKRLAFPDFWNGNQDLAGNRLG